MSNPVVFPAHYTVYPVQPIQITRYLGFCIGNATKYVLRAPYKGGAEDCLKALVYLAWEKEISQQFLCAPLYKLCSEAINQLLEFLAAADGDDLWKDIALQTSIYLEHLYTYLLYGSAGKGSGDLLMNMRDTVLELRRILALRDTTGQIYDGMTGLPNNGGSDVEKN